MWVLPSEVLCNQGWLVRKYVHLVSQVPKPQSHAGSWNNCAALNRVPKYYLPPLIPSSRFMYPFFTSSLPSSFTIRPSGPPASTPYFGVLYLALGQLGI